MRTALFLIGVVLSRVLLALLVLALVYNPWRSIYAWVYPGPGLEAEAYEQNWLFKAIAVLIVAGVLVLFIRTAHRALGSLGTAFVAAVLVLLGYVPFYFGWLDVTVMAVGDVFYFAVLPVLLGCGLSAGYVNRYLAGTLQTASMTGHHQQHAEPAAPSQDVPQPTHHG